jgi:hypothetical protein
MSTNDESVSVRRSRLMSLADHQEGVLSRRQLYAAGVTRGEVRAKVRAGRWQRVGWHGVATYSGPLTGRARQWAAVFEAGPRAFLDGTSALIASGLERFEEDRIRVSVPKGAPESSDGVVTRSTSGRLGASVPTT